MTEPQEQQEFESKLIPILREGVEVIKMILFMDLRTSLARRHPEWPAAPLSRLTGAVVNELFGTPNPQPEYAAFAAAHQEEIEQELQNLGAELGNLRIPLTDGLRVQFLCDSAEGRENPALLVKAGEWGVLLRERELPLPHNFLELVRRLGKAYGLLQPQADAGPGAS